MVAGKEMATESQQARQAINRFLDQLERANPGEKLSALGRLELFHTIENALAAHRVIDSEVRTQQVTILFSDLRGFTQIAEQLPPTELIGLLNRYFTCMNHIIHAHHGLVDKFMGDAIMVLFGLPDPQDDDLLRALRCATEMQRAMDEINQVNRDMGLPSLYMGIGINTGKVVVGNVGSEFHSEFTVIGDQVNLASRVEAHSLRGQILLSENSFGLAERSIEVTKPRRVYIKGMREPVNLYELQAVTRPALLRVPSREVRSGPRVDVDFPFHFHIVRGKGVSRKRYLGHALDLSYHGLRGRVAFPMERIHEVKLSFLDNLLSSEAEEIYAKVLSATPRNHLYEVTAEFTALPPAAESVIHHFVDRLVEGG
jgi:adenylate cyclase